MLDMYGQPQLTQPQPAHSSLLQQYQQQHQQNYNKKLKLDHVLLPQQQQAVDLCSLSTGQTDSVSLYEVSSTTGCGSSSGPSRASHGVNQGRVHASTGYALTVSAARSRNQALVQTTIALRRVVLFLEPDIPSPKK